LILIYMLVRPPSAHAARDHLLAGVIEAVSSQLNKEPILTFGGADMTHVLTGRGGFRGTGAGVMTGEAVLVLGVNNAIEGNMDISLPLVNNGLVTTDIPGVDNFADTIHLWCEPVIGAGDWQATGGGSGDGQRNWLVVDTPLAGSGDLVVGEYGGLKVHRHLTLSGTLTVERRARIEVDKEVMFDVDRFVPENCPD